MMKPPVLSEEEISKTLLSLIDAYETADIAGIQRYMSRDVDIHVHELNLRGCAAFFKIYHPEKITLSDFSVKTLGDVGWGYGTITRKNSVMHFSTVFKKKRNHEWKMVHLHLSDACL
ncbi:nuclear transport factor 2 family protein [Methanocorpusculaceae archaeon]|nr:nuclear transport factor 2 family protein [Methanocorpusculaceae archaeon]MBO5431494.1 nuclear transport factor 2 family protein [Methanocorpusculum sp.]